MIVIDKFDVVGWDHAIRGARNPMNSWDRIDSYWDTTKYINNGKTYYEFNKFVIGPNDYKLLTKLCKAGPDHRKFMRMIVVYVDILAPLYWWKEYSTYKIGTVANSCSTMHKIHDKVFELADFSHDKLTAQGLKALQGIIDDLNSYRYFYNRNGDKEMWDNMIQLLPTSYNQKRTVMLNYEVLRNMYHARKNHKLKEWRKFCAWIEELPYSELITGKEKQCEESN